MLPFLWDSMSSSIRRGVRIRWSARPLQALPVLIFKVSSKACTQGPPDSTTAHKHDWSRSPSPISFFFRGCLLPNKMYLVVNSCL